MRLSPAVSKLKENEKTQVEKNEETELPIPHLWRPTFNAIANALKKIIYG